MSDKTNNPTVDIVDTKGLRWDPNKYMLAVDGITLTSYRQNGQSVRLVVQDTDGTLLVPVIDKGMLERGEHQAVMVAREGAPVAAFVRVEGTTAAEHLEKMSKQYSGVFQIATPEKASVMLHRGTDLYIAPVDPSLEISYQNGRLDGASPYEMPRDPALRFLEGEQYTAELVLPTAGRSIEGAGSVKNVELTARAEHATGTAASGGLLEKTSAEVGIGTVFERNPATGKNTSFSLTMGGSNITGSPDPSYTFEHDHPNFSLAARIGITSPKGLLNLLEIEGGGANGDARNFHATATAGNTLQLGTNTSLSTTGSIGFGSYGDPDGAGLPGIRDDLELRGRATLESGSFSASAERFSSGVLSYTKAEVRGPITNNLEFSADALVADRRTDRNAAAPSDNGLTVGAKLGTTVDLKGLGELAVNLGIRHNEQTGKTVSVGANLSLPLGKGYQPAPIGRK